MKKRVQREKMLGILPCLWGNEAACCSSQARCREKQISSNQRQIPKSLCIACGLVVSWSPRAFRSLGPLALGPLLRPFCLLPWSRSFGPLIPMSSWLLITIPRWSSLLVPLLRKPFSWLALVSPPPPVLVVLSSASLALAKSLLMWSFDPLTPCDQLAVIPWSWVRVL